MGSLDKIWIDIGTYDGQTAKNAIENGYEVIAFEPNPRMVKMLENIDAIVIYAAAWNKDGTAYLYDRADGDNSDMGCSLIQEKRNINKDRYQKIRTINFGKYLKNLNRDVAVVKIDAEGAEYYIIESVLDNFDHKRIGEWKVEDHARWIDSDEWQQHRLKVLKRLEDLNITLNKW